MNSTTWILLAVAAVLSVTDWIAVGLHRSRLEYVAKPATMVVLIGVAIALTPASVAEQRWFVVALAFGLLGDIFLMLPTNRFVAGLAAFLVGHLAYIAGFVAAGVPVITIVSFAAVLLLPGALVATFVLRGIVRGGNGGLVGPVLVYSLVITTMAGAAIASGNVLAAGGGLLFYSSDTLIGINRFVSQRRWMPVAIIVTYHAGQALLVLSLAR